MTIGNWEPKEKQNSTMRILNPASQVALLSLLSSAPIIDAFSHVRRQQHSLFRSPPSSLPIPGGHSFVTPSTLSRVKAPLPHPLSSSPPPRSFHPRQQILTSSSSNSNHNEYYNMEMGDPFQTLFRMLKTTCQYTTRQFLRWCDRPLTQVQQWSILLVYYFFHLMVLSQHSILFGWQVIPNNKGHFCSVGWDS